MSYNLISGDIIGSITGGVFEYSKSFDVLDSLQTSPAYILASYIVENSIGFMTNPVNEDDWPLYISYMPDGSDIKTNCGSVYDTSGLKDGRLMEGQVIQHYGIQLRIRCDTHTTGWAKAEAIASALDAIVNDTVTIGSVEYRIYNVSRSGPVISLGMEEGTKERRLFTVNFIVTMKRIIS